MEVRVYDMAEVEFALRLLSEGLSMGRAAERTGFSKSSISRWANGRLPHERRRASTAGRPRRAPLDDTERAAYDAAMTENMLLRAVLDDLKGAGSSLGSISNARKTELGERLRRETGLPLCEITAFLKISKSSYEYCRARMGRDRDGLRREPVRSAFEACGRRGYRAVHAELARRGVRMSEKVVRRVMAAEGLVARRRSRRRWSSYSGEESPAPPNLPLREDGTHDFGACAPNRLWVTDITEFRLPGGRKAYLSPVVDCFDGRPVSWSIGAHPTAELANESLRAACATLSEGEHPVIHSDRGGHYRWPGWISICERNGLVRSMSRKSKSPDNARMEGFFGTLKQEFFYSSDWAGTELADFIGALDSWMRWFCSGRIKEGLGWLTPNEYRRSLGYAA